MDTFKTGLLLIAILFIALSGYTEQAGMIVHGSIRDAETGKSLPVAHIRIMETRIGTISNENGEYNLELSEVPATIIVTYIGYHSEKKTITGESQNPIDFFMQPSPIILPTVIVTPGNTAERIMSEVIKRKKEWRMKLETYKADAYTRFNLANEKNITLISESISELFWNREKGTREIIIYKHQTKNIQENDTIASARMTPNLYDDDVEFFGFNIMCPTHPDALNYYTFTIKEQRSMDDKIVYVMSVEPKSKLQPLFRGTVAVLDEDYAMINLDLEPNEAFIFPPPLNQFSFSVKQQFSNFGGDTWLPVDVRVVGKIKIKIGFLLELPMIKYSQISRLSNYQINIAIPDSLYENRRLTQVAVSNEGISVKTTKERVDIDKDIPDTDGVRAEAEPTEETVLGESSPGNIDISMPEKKQDETSKAVLENEQNTTSLSEITSQTKPLVSSHDSTAMQLTSVVHDSLFNLNRKAIPFTEEEKEAYTTIDSTMTMEEAFKPSGVLTKLAGKPEKKKKEEQSKFSSVFSKLANSFSPRLWHNRVDGLHLGLNFEKLYKKRVFFDIKSAYKTYLNRWSWGGGTELYLGEKSNSTVFINTFSGTETRQRSENYPMWLCSIPTLGGFDDYFDYYWSDRIRAGFKYGFNKSSIMLAVNLNVERHDSLKPTAFDALTGKAGSMRINPAVKEGNLRSIDLYFSWGQKHEPLAVAGIKGVVFTIEHSSPRVLGSDFAYTQYRTDINWRAITYLKRRLFPMTLDLHFSGSTSAGVLPIQRFGSIDSKFLLWTPFGSFRSLGNRPIEGEHHTALFLEHNFRTVPFELIGLRSIAEKNIGIIIHGAAGRTWISRNKIKELLYNPHYYNHVVSEAGISLNGVFGILRIDATKRLDRGGYSVGINIARIM